MPVKCLECGRRMTLVERGGKNTEPSEGSMGWFCLHCMVKKGVEIDPIIFPYYEGDYIV